MISKSASNSRSVFWLPLVCFCYCLLSSLFYLPSDAQPTKLEPQQQTLVSGQPNAPLVPLTSNQQQQQQQQRAASSLQAHLNAVQAQAQRLVLNGAAQLANSTGGKQYGNVLDAISNVGKVIQQQILYGAQAANSGNIQIITSQGATGNTEAANSKKNEYQSIVVSENQPFSAATANNQGSVVPLAGNGTTINYKEQGEQLRQEILKRAGQLQQVVSSSLEVLKNNGDLIVRRLLEQLNHRLEQAKSKADKIINEPATNEIALKALGTINQGLNNVNNIITNIVNRLDINGKDSSNGSQTGTSIQQLGSSQRIATNNLLDPNRFKLNLHQIGQQFSSALNAVQQQQRAQQQQPQPISG